MGIRARIAMLVFAVVSTCVVAMTLYAADQDRQERMNFMRERHIQMLEAIGVTSAVHVAQNDMAGLDALIAHVSTPSLDPDLVELSVLDGEARVLANSDPTRFGQVRTDAFHQRALRTAAPIAERVGSELWLSVPAISGLRWATVTARYSLERVEGAVAKARMRWLLGGLGVTVLLSVALAMGLHFVVVRPVRKLRRAARSMGEGELQVRVPPLGSGDLGELGETFNLMAAALEEERENLERTVEERTRELREANRTLERIAVTDGLTGIFNHRRFQEQLSQEVLRAQRGKHPLSVVMLDVDHFKRFNDTHGHPAGDALLRSLAQLLSGELRAIDMLARYGGEEFGLLLPETPKEEALQVAERLRARVEQELNQHPGLMPVTISVGLATLGADGDTAETLLHAADQALYEAKRSGRNRVVVARREAA